MNALWKYRTLYISAIVVMFLVDQGTKIWAIQVLGHHNTTFEIIPGFFEFRLIYNTGAAWGILQGWTQGLAVMSTVMIIIILTVLGKTNLKDRLLGWALSFQVGGALGNLYDRVSTRPGVVDFLNVHIPYGGGKDGFWYNLFGKLGLETWQRKVAEMGPIYDYPIFNFADIWVVIGTILLLIYIITMPPEKNPASVNSEKEPERGTSIPDSESDVLILESDPVIDQTYSDKSERVGDPSSRETPDAG